MLAVLLIFTMAATVYGGGRAPQQQTSAKEKAYRWVMSADLETINAHFSVDSNLLVDVYTLTSAGLYINAPSPDGKALLVAPNIASGEPRMIDRDGYVWQIDIRREAKWDNGAPINADTFMYSYKMLLDPLMVNRMANFLYDRFVVVKNAREYYFQRQAGNSPVRWEDVGIKKINDYTIEFTLSQKSNGEYLKRHLTDRSLFPVYEPLYEAGMNAERTATNWGTSLETYMGCGPYTYSSWNQGASHIFVKKADHWMSNRYKFDRFECRIVPDRNARVQMFQNGEIDVLTLDSVTLEFFRDDPRVKSYTGISPWHIDINSVNTNNPILANLNFRKALFYVIDRKTIGDLLGVLPAAYYVNHQAPGYNNLPYRATAEAKAVEPANFGYNPTLAKQHFDRALSEAGLGNVSVELLYSEADSNYKVLAEFFEQAWPRIFGADKFRLNLRAVPDAMAWSLNKWAENPTGFELGFNDWGSSLSRVFPFAAFQYFHSGYTSRPNSYVTDRFNAAWNLCNTEETKGDMNLMVRRTADLEKIYIEDVINVPLFQEYTRVVYSEKLILPCPEYVPVIGFGSFFADMKLD